jgi:hypothetical protein
MLQTLKLHPDDKCDAVTQIGAEVVRRESVLELRYLLSGNVDAVRLPAFAEPRRGEELWQHSCFEAFIREPESDTYLELNFAPSGEWAAYRFARYRGGRSDLEPAPLRFETRRGEGVYELRAACLLDLPAQAPWQLNITTIVEETSGRKSYWALAHPRGKADFHHDDGFVLHLPAIA